MIALKNFRVYDDPRSERENILIKGGPKHFEWKIENKTKERIYSTVKGFIYPTNDLSKINVFWELRLILFPEEIQPHYLCGETKSQPGIYMLRFEWINDWIESFHNFPPFKVGRQLGEPKTITII